MVWFIQPRQRKNEKDEPLGLWHLCANSDEGGGFVVGCAHEHCSAEEAQDCTEAQLKLAQVTGFPLRETTDPAKPSAEQLREELGRAYRALRGMYHWIKRGELPSQAALGYHSLTIGAAIRYVDEGALDGADYFVGKPVTVLHEALAKG